jgi:hypothetical protein
LRKKDRVEMRTDKERRKRQEEEEKVERKRG